jgi:hypothetical protein
MVKHEKSREANKNVREITQVHFKRVQESSMTYWLDRLPSGNQKRFYKYENLQSMPYLFTNHRVGLIRSGRKASGGRSSRARSR